MKRSLPLLVLLLMPLAAMHAETWDHSETNPALQAPDSVPLAPEKYRRPGKDLPPQYQYSVEELKNRYSAEIMKKAAESRANISKINGEGKWKPTAASIEEHQAPEWFLDAKFGMFVDWGPWSIAGWAPKEKTGAMYPDWYENRLGTERFRPYHEKNWGKDFKHDDFLPLFQARDYDPEKLAAIARQAGMKYVVPFCKHHGGYCLWPSSFTRRNSLEMGPKKDLIGPLAESCKKEGLKFGFYFSVNEWDYPILGEDNTLQSFHWGKIFPKPIMESVATGKIAVRDFMMDYSLPQAAEFIDRYDPDLIWYDGQWGVEPEQLKTYDISAYLYNKAEGRKDVAVNDRYGKGPRRGDFLTSEYHSMKQDAKKTYHPWEECRGISQSFGFNWQDTAANIISSKEFLSMFLDIVSRGGNLLLIVNLEGQGALPAIQKDRLEEIGKWLAVNGEAIYATRMYSTTSEGPVRYTRSKDNKTVYAITTDWPGKTLELKSVVPRKGTAIYLLGEKEPLQWTRDDSKGVTVIAIPERLQKESNRPCKDAYAFRVEVEPQQ